MTRPVLLLALALAACDDPSTGSSAATDPHGVGMTTVVEGARMTWEAGLDGMGFGLSTPEGDHVRMGVRATPDSAAMGVALDAADGTAFALEVHASEDGARLVLGL